MLVFWYTLSIIDFFGGNHFQNNILDLYFISFLIPQVTNFFDFIPICFSQSPNVVHFFFLHSIFLLTPHFFWFYKQFFFHEGHFSSYNHELWSLAMMLNSHELNQNNIPKTKACNWSIAIRPSFFNKKIPFSIH
jgi:hypothetical protein